jgi:hypothetical protein
MAQEKSRVENMMGAYISELGGRSILGKAVLLRGEAKLALVGKSVQCNADLMVMGSRGLGQLKK